jgi:MFS family permease
MLPGSGVSPTNNGKEFLSMNSPAVPPTQAFSRAYTRFALMMLTLVYAFNFIDRQILVVLQEPIMAEMGLSDVQLGLLSGFSFALIYVIAGIPIAYWADRGNRRNIIALALTVWSGMTALSGLTQNFAQLMAARVGVGLGEAGGSPPAHSMISDYYPPEQRGTALSIYSCGLYLGAAAGFLVAGFAADALGWRMVFMLVGVPGVLFAILLRFTLKEPRRGRWDTVAAAAYKPGLRETLTVLRQRPSFWLIALACGMMAFGSYGIGNFLPSFLIRNHNMSLSEIGVAMAAISVLGGMVGTFLGGYLADKLGVKDKRWYLWLPMYGALLAFFPMLYILWSDNTLVILVMLGFTIVLNSLYLGPAIAMCHTIVPPSMRAITSAMMFFVLNMIGMGMGPLVTGLGSDLLEPVYGNNSLRYSMIITAIIASSSILLLFLASRKLPADLVRQNRAH